MKQEEQGLPRDLAFELRQLAETETAGTRPFPQFNRTLQHSRQVRLVRYGGMALAAAVTVAVISVEVLAGGAFDRGQPSTPVTPSPSVTVPTARLEKAKYPTETQGTLAENEAWLSALRKRVRATAAEPIAADEDVWVVAAGDIPKRAGRYAIVLYPFVEGGNQRWSRAFWLGEPGAAASTMVPVHSDRGEGAALPTKPLAVFTAPKFAPTKPVVLISAPNDAWADEKPETEAIINAQRTFHTYKYRPQVMDVGGGGMGVTSLAAGVWASAVGPEEYFMSQVVLMGMDPIASVTTAGGLDLAAVAAPGTEAADLGWLRGTTVWPQTPTAKDKAVYAGTAPAGDQGQLVAALLRTEGGEHVFAFTEHQPSSASGVNDDRVRHQFDGVVWAGPDTDEVMAGAVRSHDGGQRYLLLVPKGTAQVRVGKVTAPAHGRLAVVDVPDQSRRDPAQRAQALAADGSVLADIKPDGAARPDSEVPADFTAGEDGRSVRM